LQSLTNLTVLDLFDNPIEDITPLQSITNLTVLTIGAIKWAEQINDISPLQSLANLTQLTLGPNIIEDITPLQSLTNLTSLFLDFTNTQISDITSLQSLTNLTSLTIFSRQLSDIKSLQSLTNLTYLDLRGNLISDIIPLQALVNLTELNLARNQISDITPLQSLTNLTALDLNDNPISEGQIRELKEALPNCEIDFTFPEINLVVTSLQIRTAFGIAPDDFSLRVGETITLTAVVEPLGIDVSWLWSDSLGDFSSYSISEDGLELTITANSRGQGRLVLTAGDMETSCIINVVN